MHVDLDHNNRESNQSNLRALPARQTVRIFLPEHSWLISLLITAVVVTYISALGVIGTRTLASRLDWGHGAVAAGALADTVQGRFARWDSGYYLIIAQDGYRPDGPERAFFPLYPLLARLVSASSGLSILWSGWLISIGCYAASGLVLYQWMLAEYDQHTARWCQIWFSIFPVAFFDTAFYPESLFHLASISGMFYCRRGQFLRSGLCIAVAGAARPVAFLLAIPFFVEFIRQHDFHRSRWLDFGLGALMAPLGTLSYYLFLAIQSGGRNPLTVYNDNLAYYWDMSTVWPWVTLHDGINAALFRTGIGYDWFSLATVGHDMLYLLLGLMLAIWAWGRLPWSMSLLLLCGMLFFLTSHGPNGYVFEGMPRHVASLFPVYIALGLITVRLPVPLRWMLAGLSIALLGLLSVWFASGRWVA